MHTIHCLFFMYSLFLFQSQIDCIFDFLLLSTLSLNFRGFQYAQVILFAIDEINNSTDLLPGISLGYKIYDACASIAKGIRVALALANGNDVAFIPSEAPCTRPAQVQAIMGETFSSPCMAISTAIGPFNIPLVGEIDKNEMTFVKMCLKLFSK